MNAYNKPLEYIPSVGAKHSVETRVKAKPLHDFYTLSFLPDQSIISIEKPGWEEESVKNYSWKDFLVAVEDVVAGKQEAYETRKVTQESNQNKSWSTPFSSRWQNNTTVTIPAHSPLETTVIEKPELDVVHTLHLQPFHLTSQSRTTNDSNKPNFDKTSHEGLKDFLNRKLSESEYTRSIARDISQSQGLNTDSHCRETHGREFAENPESEVYNTDSVIDENE